MIRNIVSLGLARTAALVMLIVCNACLVVLLLADVPVVADIVTPLTGHVIGFGIAAALALIAKRYAAFAMGGGVVLTLAFHAWLGLSPANLPAPRLAAFTPAADSNELQDLTILSLNTWDARDNVDELITYFKTAPADVVVLSEVGPPKQRLVAALREVYPYQKECTDDWGCSIALLSRVPFEQGGTVRWSRQSPAFVWARFAGALTIVGTHIARPSRTPALHARETEAVAQLVRLIDGSVVLVGDLNSSPWSYSFRALKAQTGLVTARALTPSWPAWPINVPQVALDHILVSQDLAFVESKTGPAVGSDHLPVMARLKLVPTTVRAREPVRSGGSRLAAPVPHLGGELLADLGGKHHGAGDLGL